MLSVLCFTTSSMENPAIAWCIWTLNKISESVAVTWNLISQNWMSFRFLNDFDLESSEWFCKNFHWIFSHIFSLFLFLVHHPLGPRRQKHPGQAINNNLITIAVRVEPCRSSRTRTTFCGILKALTSARNRERFVNHCDSQNLLFWSHKAQREVCGFFYLQKNKYFIFNISLLKSAGNHQASFINFLFPFHYSLHQKRTVLDHICVYSFWITFF